MFQIFLTYSDETTWFHTYLDRSIATQEFDHFVAEATSGNRRDIVGVVVGSGGETVLSWEKV
jgi:hypothetical protein